MCRELWPAGMASCCQLLILFIFAVFDISLTTLTFVFWARIDIGAFAYRFTGSIVEFWLCSVVRSSLLSGAVIGRLWNTADDSRQRLQHTWPASAIIAVLMMMFAVVKMLAYTEVNRSSALFWCQFAWMLVASIAFHAGFILLRRMKRVDSIVINASINSENDERQPLLSGNSTEETPSDETTQKKMSVVLRLLSYSKPDAHLITVAFVFMIASAICKYYLVHTGAVVGHILILICNKSRSSSECRRLNFHLVHD